MVIRGEEIACFIILGCSSNVWPVTAVLCELPHHRRIRPLNAVLLGLFVGEEHMQQAAFEVILRHGISEANKGISLGERSLACSIANLTCDQPVSEF